MQRKTEKQIFAHSIAKQIHGFAKDNWEIDDIIGRITWIFKYCREREKTGIPEYPVDEWGNKLEILVLCQDLAQNKMRSFATKLLTENRPSHTFFQSR